MSEGNGKTIGAAAAGATGLIAVLLKAGSAEVHMAGAGARAAGIAGRETVQVGMAGERALVGGARAGGAAAAAAGENAVVRAAAGAHFLEGLTPTSRATLEAFGDAPLTTIGQRAPRAAGARVNVGARIKEVLKDPDTIVEVLDHVQDVWDLKSALDPDTEEELQTKFAAAGLDFEKEVAPAVTHAPFSAVPGAQRALFSDGKMLIPGLHLESQSSGLSQPLDLTERRAVLGEIMLATAPRHTALFVQRPVGVPDIDRLIGTPLLSKLAISQDLRWRSIRCTTSESDALPRIIELGDVRYVSVVQPSAPTRIVLVSHEPATP